MNEVIQRIRQWEALSDQVPLRFKEVQIATAREAAERFPLPAAWDDPINEETLQDQEDWLSVAIDRWKVTDPAATEFRTLTRQLAVDCERSGLDSTPLLTVSVSLSPLNDEVRRLLARLEAAAGESSKLDEEPEPSGQHGGKRTPEDLYASMVEQDPAKHLWKSTRWEQVLKTPDATIRGWPAWQKNRWLRDQAHDLSMQQRAEDAMKKQRSELESRD